MPYYPGGPSKSEDDKIYYKPETEGEHLVISYLGLSILEIQEMDIDDYLFYLREAYIYRMNQTKEGREYLANCWRMTQTKPDRKKLRKQMKGGAINGRKH